MTLDLNMLQRFYATYSSRVKAARVQLNRPLTYAEKVLFAHLYNGFPAEPLRRGESYVDFRPDRVAMQDATAQMALLQFMNAGRVMLPCRLPYTATILSGQMWAWRKTCQRPRPIIKRCMTFSVSLRQIWHRLLGSGAGIIHQVVLENYAFPGGMMVGTDSHTPNAGGLGMVAVGVGGADAVDVLTGQAWELKLPRLIGVHLKGQLSGWASPKDVILEILGQLTVKGGTNAILEYFGEGVVASPPQAVPRSATWARSSVRPAPSSPSTTIRLTICGRRDATM